MAILRWSRDSLRFPEWQFSFPSHRRVECWLDCKSQISVLPNPSWCARRFERPKHKTSEFGVRKGLLIQKMPTKKIGALIVPEIHLACCTRWRVLNSWGGTSMRKLWEASFSWRTWDLAICWTMMALCFWKVSSVQVPVASHSYVRVLRFWFRGS